MPLRESIDIEELKLESPYKEICKDVRNRVLFLFELRPSIDFHSNVIKIDQQHLRRKG